jgi:hypothetical protein
MLFVPGSIMLIHSGGARWSLWAKAGAVGNGAAVVHGKLAGAAQPHRPQIHRAGGSADPVEVLRVRAQPVSPQSLELALEQWGVRALAFVAKPEQLPERTSHDARMGYDERFS